MLNYRMNFFDYYPDEIYKQLHKSYMNDIKSKLKNEINRRWDCLDEYDMKLFRNGIPQNTLNSMYMM